MKKLLFVVAVAVVSFIGGRVTAQRDVRELALGHALEKTALCANGLNKVEKTNALLDQQLRLAVDTMDELTRAGISISEPIPNLIDGVRRAKAYADRVGDSELSKRLASVQARLATTR